MRYVAARAAGTAAPGLSGSQRRAKLDGLQKLSIDESKLLTKGIKETTTVEQMLDILDAAGPVMNQIHISASLIHVAQMQAAGRIPADRQDHLQNFLAAWTDVAGGCVQKFDERALANVTYALGKLQHADEELPKALLDQSYAKLSTFEPQHLSNMIWGLAILNEVPPLDWLSLFFTSSVGKLGHFSPQGLSNTIYALGRIGCEPDSTWMGAFMGTATAQLASFKPQELSNTLYGLARCDIHSSHDFDLYV